MCQSMSGIIIFWKCWYMKWKKFPSWKKSENLICRVASPPEAPEQNVFLTKLLETCMSRCRSIFWRKKSLIRKYLQKKPGQSSVLLGCRAKVNYLDPQVLPVNQLFVEMFTFSSHNFAFRKKVNINNVEDEEGLSMIFGGTIGCCTGWLWDFF